jgi:hypothetical protein
LNRDEVVLQCKVNFSVQQQEKRTMFQWLIRLVWHEDFIEEIVPGHRDHMARLVTKGRRRQGCSEFVALHWTSPPVISSVKQTN